MSDKLSDCPFCGSDQVSMNGGSYYAMCRNCGAEGPWKNYNDASAIAAWNRRASPAPAIPAVDPVAIHDAALEAAATAVEDHDRDGREWINGSLWDTLTREASARIRALKGEPIPAHDGSAAIIEACAAICERYMNYCDKAFELERAGAAEHCAKEIRGLLAVKAAPAISESDLLALLPGTTYMDEPDGGSPSLFEQLQRMAEDAARYRWLRDENRETPDGTRELMAVQYRLPFSEGTDTELFDTALDAAIDAARKGEKS